MKKRIALVVLTAFASVHAADAPKQPNFLAITGEAQGWSSSSVQMDDAVPGSNREQAAATDGAARRRGEKTRAMNSRVEIARLAATARKHLSGIQTP